MKKVLHKILMPLMLVCGALSIQAQEVSPYSMIGYGVLNDRTSSTQRAMGGTGYAVQQRGKINAKNPASFAAIDSMTFLFDMGVDAGAVLAHEKDLHVTKPLGGLDYITLQVPIGKWMGASVGLLPYSSVGYSFGQEVTNGIGSYSGQGGISEVYLGWAARPVKGLTLGVSGGYLFGNVINDVYATASNGSVSLYERVHKIRDYNVQFGAQYGLTFNHKNHVSVGATFTLPRKVHGTAYGTRYDVTQGSSSPDKTPTIHLDKAGYTMPWSLGAGLAYELDSRLLVAADFTYQPWSDSKFPGIEGFSQDQTFSNRTKYSIGAEFTPSKRGGYFKRMSYRIGAFHGRDYMMIDGNHVNDMGLTCGFGFPTPLRTTVNLGFEYRHRSSSPAVTVTENYYMVTLGIALNEIWFLPSKIR
ncbi:MAG: hypothetical protein HDS64_10430 [Bacteroidales bacterium]|nr:hypothetical protein [Bacteroidales bacterium]MBD5352498.1 hypothetical protein [Bacteroides sp.]MBD5372467.1 hypothetical protein [Bacteroides sp.]MDE6262391.1 hypothetical protein [Muribaculaceae bacterium]MDE6428304.1 hypothetical protein [Muribaculaceae bacterium]